MSTVNGRAARVTHSSKPRVRINSVKFRASVLDSASAAYTLAQDLAGMVDAKMAEVFHEHRTTFNRAKNGQAPSAKSRTRDQILRIGMAGGAAGWALAMDDIAAAAQSTILDRGVGELRALAREVHLREQKANGRLDEVQFKMLLDMPFCVKEARMAKLEQCAWTVILLAIMDALAVHGVA